MSGKFEYYEIEDSHEAVFERLKYTGYAQVPLHTSRPLSYHELLFLVEAHTELTGIDIWKYVKMMDMEDLHKDPPNKLVVKESEEYPYEKLLFCFLKYGITTPLIFRRHTDGDLICLEGKHRYRLIRLLYTFKKEIYYEYIYKVPVIIVKSVDLKESIKPNGYLNWADYVRVNNLCSLNKKTGEIYAELVHQE